MMPKTDVPESVSSAPPRRGRPPKPKPLAPPEAPVSEDAGLAHIQAVSDAPRVQAERGREQLRAQWLSEYETRVGPVLAHLEQFRDENQAMLARLMALNWTELARRLRPGSRLATDLRRAVEAARTAFEPYPDGIPSVLQQLRGIRSKISALEAHHDHPCRPTPPGCGCVLGKLRAKVDAAPNWISFFERAIEAVHDLKTELQTALRREAADGAHPRPAPARGTWPAPRATTAGRSLTLGEED